MVENRQRRGRSDHQGLPQQVATGLPLEPSRRDLQVTSQPRARRGLDGVYVASGAAACLAAICVVRLAQVVGRETGFYQ